jgi:hypothetical protein
MTDSSNGASTSRFSLPGPGVAGSTTQTSSTPALSPEQILAKECLDIVESFRHSRISKSNACVDLTHLIELQAFDTTPEGIALVAAPYFDMLDQWQEELGRAAATPGVAARCHQPEPSEAGDHQEVPVRETGNDSDSGDEGRQPTRKRYKLDMSCLDHATKSESSAPTLSANLKRTNAVLLSWSQDPKEARRRLMYHELSPEFHESGWMEIVTGKCINLDNVYSIIASSRTIDKHTETLGGIELRYGTSEAVSKRITTQSAWIVAWTRAARALRFAFPHRKAELDAYQEYICCQFGTNEENCHSRAIRFDKAIRNRVASSRRYELSDFAAFHDIFHAHFNSGGKHFNEEGVSTSAATKEKAALAKREPCNKWNNNECTRSASSCRYAHICSFKQDGRFCGRRHIKEKHVDERKA